LIEEPPDFPYHPDPVRDGETTAYLFQCRHCGTHLAYWDGA
jgi:uncharacterized protein CbrC (UPF0167 family)